MDLVPVLIVRVFLFSLGSSHFAEDLDNDLEAEPGTDERKPLLFSLNHGVIDKDKVWELNVVVVFFFNREFHDVVR